MTAFQQLSPNIYGQSYLALITDWVIKENKIKPLGILTTYSFGTKTSRMMAGQSQRQAMANAKMPKGAFSDEA